MTELNDNTPVFCTAEIPADLLNDFFHTANNAPEFAAEGVDDVGTVIPQLTSVAKALTSKASSSTTPTSQPSQVQQRLPSLHRRHSHS
jgi:hypothetical protein